MSPADSLKADLAQRRQFESQLMEIRMKDFEVCCEQREDGKCCGYPTVVCPSCGLTDVQARHHHGDFYAPECHYKQCADCGFQFDHQ